jgi:hypothetical protein
VATLAFDAASLLQLVGEQLLSDLRGVELLAAMVSEVLAMTSAA